VGDEVQLQSCRASAPELNGELHALVTLTPGQNPSTHSAGGWVGSRADMNGFGEKKISCPSQDSNPGLPRP